jgi:hypothetical protein
MSQSIDAKTEGKRRLLLILAVVASRGLILLFLLFLGSYYVIGYLGRDFLSGRF